MKKIFFAFGIGCLGWGVLQGCGGSHPDQNSDAPAFEKDVPSVVSGTGPTVGESLVPSDPVADEPMKPGRGLIRLYMVPYDHCKVSPCETKKDAETEEDRRRYSAPPSNR